MATKMLHGISVELTAEELAEHEEAQATAQAASRAVRDAQVIADAKKASGKSKLKELGLDDAEIKALTGA